MELSKEDLFEFCQKLNINSQDDIDNLIEKSIKIYDELQKLMALKNLPKTVMSIYGGSGVGKTTISSILNYIFQQNNVNSYILSGDNYPRRIPIENDLERIRIYREYGVKGLVRNKSYSEEIMCILKDLQGQDLDFDPVLIEKYNWLEIYQSNGRVGLQTYLGTDLEIDFSEISNTIADFKQNEERILIRNLGRTEDALFYENIDFKNIDVLILEWTHGNNELLKGVDLPVYLVSTPEETLEWRKKRNKDTGVGNPFTNQVLEIEQSKLNQQAINAKLIVSQKGNILTCKEFYDLYKE